MRRTAITKKLCLVRSVGARSLGALLFLPSALAAQDPTTEATIATLQRAMLEQRTTAVQLVEAYLARIDAYDKRGPSFNAITVVNPSALTRAAELDAELTRTGRLSGPLADPGLDPNEAGFLAAEGGLLGPAAAIAFGAVVLLGRRRRRQSMNRA
jgi:hypothetical protein